MIALHRPECPNPAALKKNTYDDPANKEALIKASHGKCMYCESKMGHVSFPQIEHIKPKAKYPELEFVWENLGICCQYCNTNKGQKYDEDLPFINPYNENPQEHIKFIGFLIFAKQSSRRGEYTIKEIGLDRPDLRDRRKDRIKSIETLINGVFRTSSDSLRKQAIEDLISEAEADKEYSAAVKSVLIARGII